MDLNCIQEIFNNREIAIILWLIPVALYFVLAKQTRSAVSSLVKAFFQKRLITVQLLAWTYLTAIIVIMRNTGFWNTSMLKDTIIWTLITSFYLIMKAFGKKGGPFFKPLLLDLLKIITIFELVANMYTFSLVTEIILFPILALISALLGYSENQEKYNAVNKFLTNVAAIFGLWVLGYSIYQISIHFNELSISQIGLNYLFPIWMTVSFVPFIYATLLYDTYHQTFNTVDFKVGHRDRGLAKYLKRKLILKCTFNVWAIQKKRKEINASYLTSKKDVDAFLR